MLFVPQEQAPGKPKSADAELPDGNGKDVVVKHCTMCHAANTFSRQRHDKDKWNQIIDNMTSKGMEATDTEIDTIATYLSTNFGPDTPAAEPAAPKPATPNR
jgi:cytochrome c5